MKNLSLRILSLGIVVALGIGGLVSNAFAATAPTAKVKIVYVLEGQLPSNANISTEDKKLLQENGWIFEGQTVKRRYDNKNTEIIQKGQKKLVDNNGVFEVQLSKDEEDVDIQLTKNEKDIRKVHLKKGETALVEKKISLEDLFNSMGKPQTEDNAGTTSYDAGPPSDGRQYYGGEDVHCNRFNGYLGNGKYYSNHFVGLVNFTQSDCDVSLGRGFYSNCWSEDLGLTNNRYCAWDPSYKRGMCSLDSDHNWVFHQHTGFFSPSGW